MDESEAFTINEMRCETEKGRKDNSSHHHIICIMVELRKLIREKFSAPSYQTKYAS